MQNNVIIIVGDTVSIKKNIINKIIEPINNTKYDMLLATVVTYDEINNRANIVFEDPNIKGQMYLENVPVQLGSGGVHSSGPFAGDEVWISFQNSTPLHPKIISLADENYSNKTRENLRHIRKGSLIPFDTNNSYKDIPKGNNLNTWIDESNTSDIYLPYKDLNPENDLEKSASNIFYYKAEDPGITHPINSSTIRIRDNGAIDIFVSTNEGVRVNPVDKSINILSTNINESTDYKKVIAKTVDITSDVTNINSKVWTITAENIKLKVNKNIDMECENFNLLGKFNKVGE